MSSFTSSSKSESTSSKRKRYDMYLSFCDQDSHSFALGIYSALTSKHGVVVFWEDRRSKQPSDSTLHVIGDCEMAIIVFSKNYFNSRWCFEEMEKITKCCQRTKDALIVLPFFYDGVYPNDGGLQGWSEVIHDFVDRISMEKETFSEDEDKFMTWVAAITDQAFKYDGLLDLYLRRRDESEYIQHVAACAQDLLNTNRRGFFRNYFTGSIYSRAQDVIQLLKQSKSPLLLGIWGMTGIGKSTIAEAIYNQIGPYFEHKCILGTTIWEHKGQIILQEKLLSYIDDTTKIPTVESGRVILKERLRHKRVLLILDNVNKLEQLQALCGNQDWFGSGSKIIITTIDRHLLKEHGVNHIYRVKELDESESLELFSAFSPPNPPEDFDELSEDFGEFSRQLVAYCGGLPLALQAIGELLHEKEPFQWKGVLRSLERFSIPDPSLLEELEDSLSNLSDEEKHIFFDIACFFDRMNQKDVLQTLNRSIQCTTLQLSLLEDKSFVTIDENNKLQMHVLHQAMARDIITRESSNKTDQPKMYDVFLSFRGEDCRAKFMSHLYSSLQNAGIYAFRDDDEVQRGDQISISLLQAIGRSRISIVVLSTRYANSRWCMLELEKIMEIGRTRGLVVVPVFYEVDPSEVRHQTGQFGFFFENLISTISVDESTKCNWRRDLIDIGGIAGFVLIESRLFEFSLRILFVML